MRVDSVVRGASTVIAVAALLAAPSALAQERPDVLLVTIDTLRWNALGCYGARIATPGMDSVAAQGARFEYASAHAVVTLPSHVSILTGLDPSRHGVHENNGFRADEGLVMLAERMQDAGYATGAFVGAFPLDSQFGLAQGFDVYDDYYEVGARDRTDMTMVQRRGEDVVAAAQAWIERQTGPWFAWVHLYDPHFPYDPQEPYASQYPESSYAGDVAYTDAALRPLLEDSLDAGNLVVVTSDHGEGLGEHGEQTHGVFAYDGTLRVPLMIAWPGRVAAGRVVSGRARHVDIFPTVLDLTGLEPGGVQGESLRPVLDGRDGAAIDGAVIEDQLRPLYFQSLTPYYTRNWAPLRGIYSGRHKYIELPIPELYDIVDDPLESANLAEVDPERVVALRATLAEHLAGGRPMDSSVPVVEDSETIARLEALGYLAPTSVTDRPREFGPEDDPKNLIELDTRLHEGIGLSVEGNVDAALEVVDEILATRPDWTRAHALGGMVAFGAGRLVEAIERLERAVRDEGLAVPLLLTQLGGYLRVVGRYEEAARVLEMSLEQEPDDLVTLAMIGAVYEALDRIADAVGVMDSARRLDPTFAPLNANFGTVLLKLGRIDEARASFESALQYDASLSVAHNGLGVIAMQEDRPEDAVQRWQRATELDRNNFQAFYNLGITLTRVNRFREAIPVIQEFVDRAPATLYGDDIPGMRRLLERLKRDFGSEDPRRDASKPPGHRSE